MSNEILADLRGMADQHHGVCLDHRAPPGGDSVRNIYIAGRFESQSRLRNEAARIRLMGVGHVVSQWLWQENAEVTSTIAQGAATAADALRYAMRDAGEVIGLTELLILDTFDEDHRGGREQEAGMAYGSGAEVWVVGPQRNVFHHLYPHFKTWDEVLDALRKERDRADV